MPCLLSSYDDNGVVPCVMTGTSSGSAFKSCVQCRRRGRERSTTFEDDLISHYRLCTETLILKAVAVSRMRSLEWFRLSCRSAERCLRWP